MTLRNITRIRRSVRAVSPVVAVLLMIVIAIVASIIVYAWIMGYLGNTTSKAGNAILIQSITTDSSSKLLVYVQNVGQGDVVIDSAYVNDALVAQTLSIVLAQGATQTVPTSFTVTSEETLRVKIVAEDGTFAEYTGKVTLGNIPTNQVDFILGSGGASMTPSGTQYYTTGTTIIVRAVPASGYQFLSWTSTGSITFDSTASATTNAHINGEGSITANFIAKQPTQNYQVTFNLGSGGASMSPTGTQTYAGGSNVPVIAYAASGYQFSSWTGSGSITFDSATSASTVAHINSAGSITANFVAQQPSQNYQVTFILGTGGASMTPTGTQTYAGGSAVPIFAAPNSGYQFSYWISSATSGSIIIDSAVSASTTAHINGDGTITAVFAPIQTGQNYQVTFSTSGGGASSTTNPTGTQTYAAGTIVPISATAGSGYQFSSWSTTGSISFGSSTSASTTATINGEGTIIANFIVSQPTQNYQVTFILGDGGASMTPSGTQTYAGGSSVTVSAVAASGYQFSSWTSTGSISFDASTSNPTNAHINGQGTITANFIPTTSGQSYQVTFHLGDGGASMSPTGTQTYTAGETVPITATPTTGYKFSSWTNTGTITFDSTTTASTNAHINSDGSITANFELDNKLHITATAGAHGQISPSGTVEVNYGANQPFTITPDTGYVVASLTVDGSPAGYGRSYTFTNVVADHTIAVTFTQGSTAINTGFDGAIWDEWWLAASNPPWYPGADEGIDGTTAAKSDPYGINSGAFTANATDMRGASTIRITFMYKVLNTDNNNMDSSGDLRLAYCGRTTSTLPNLNPNSPHFIYKASIGRPAEDNVWYTGSLTLTSASDSTAFREFFYFRFESDLEINNPGDLIETVWVDNVIITKSP